AQDQSPLHTGVADVFEDLPCPPFVDGSVGVERQGDGGDDVVGGHAFSWSLSVRGNRSTSHRVGGSTERFGGSFGVVVGLVHGGCDLLHGSLVGEQLLHADEEFGLRLGARPCLVRHRCPTALGDQVVGGLHHGVQLHVRVLHGGQAGCCV